MRIPFENMLQEFNRVLLKAGFTDKRAELCARLFAETSRDGVYSHGLNRFPRFMDNIKEGIVNIHAEPEKKDTFGILERWDGNLGPGNLNAYFCMDRAIQLAHENKMGCVALKNTNHWMRGGSYGWQAADAGCIGICWTNTMPNMPPWGGQEVKLGNNPFIMAVPCSQGHVVLDMAMSLFSFGKLESMRRKGEMLPYDGGFDNDGNLTRDPAAIEDSFRPLPIGFWKGSGFSLMLDLVVTLLSQGRSVHDIEFNHEYGLSQIFIAFDIEDLTDRQRADKMVNDIIDDLHTATPDSADGHIYYPGEKTLLTRKENMENGIPVDPEYWYRVLAM